MSRDFLNASSNMDLKDQAFSAHDEVRATKTAHQDAVGTVRLLDADEVVLIPTPSPDPRGGSILQRRYGLKLTFRRPSKPIAMAKVVGYIYSGSL